MRNLSIIENNYDNCPFEITLPKITKSSKQMIILASFTIDDSMLDQITITDFSIRSKNGEELFLSLGSQHIRSKSSQVEEVLSEEDTAFHCLPGGIIEIKIHDSNDKRYAVQFQVNEDLSTQLSHIAITEHYNENLVMPKIRKKSTACSSTLNK